MNNLHLKDSAYKSFFKSKGFYIAMSALVIAIAVAAYTAVIGANADEGKVTEDSTDAANIVHDITVTEATQPSTEAIITTESVFAPTEATEEMTEDMTFQATEEATEANAEVGEVRADLFIYPVNGDILNTFSDNELAYSETFKDYRIHNGVDIAAEKGAQVKTSGAGVVTKVYADDLLGTVIEINHGNGIIGYYCGVNENPPVSEGDVLATNDIIGSINEVPSELAIPSHLHFAVLKDGEWIDPISLLTTIG